MKHSSALERHNLLLRTLSHLPKKIVLLYGFDQHPGNISEFVLHDFCDSSCFGLTQAAYFVDNPDFNCFKGVAGVCRKEAIHCEKKFNVWDQPEKYNTCMQQSPFNQKVRSIEHTSIAHQKDEKNTVDTVAHELGFSHYDYYKWPMKHGNHGFLVFECDQEEEEEMLIKEHLPQGVYLLGLCPVS